MIGLVRTLALLCVSVVWFAAVLWAYKPIHAAAVVVDMTMRVIVVANPLVLAVFVWLGERSSKRWLAVLWCVAVLGIHIFGMSVWAFAIWDLDAAMVIGRRGIGSVYSMSYTAILLLACCAGVVTAIIGKRLGKYTRGEDRGRHGGC